MTAQMKVYGLLEGDIPPGSLTVQRSFPYGRKDVPAGGDTIAVAEDGTFTDTVPTTGDGGIFVFYTLTPVPGYDSGRATPNVNQGGDTLFSDTVRVWKTGDSVLRLRIPELAGKSFQEIDAYLDRETDSGWLLANQMEHSNDDDSPFTNDGVVEISGLAPGRYRVYLGADTEDWDNGYYGYLPAASYDYGARFAFGEVKRAGYIFEVGEGTSEYTVDIAKAQIVQAPDLVSMGAKGYPFGSVITDASPRKARELVNARKAFPVPNVWKSEDNAPIKLLPGPNQAPKGAYQNVVVANGGVGWTTLNSTAFPTSGPEVVEYEPQRHYGIGALSTAPQIYGFRVKKAGLYRISAHLGLYTPDSIQNAQVIIYAGYNNIAMVSGVDDVKAEAIAYLNVDDFITASYMIEANGDSNGGFSFIPAQMLDEA